MREDYVPNEKYRNMFGVERNGYGMERVDLYLAQLEVAFKKIREDNRNLKRELAEQGGAQTQSLGLMPPQDMSAVQAQQEQYIAQLQAQLAEQQAINQHLAAQLSEQQDEAHSHGAAQTEGLMAQITALRAEADMLRQQLRYQPATPMQAINGGQGFAEDDKQSLIGKVLVEARAQADETLHTARQEAEHITRQARQQAETLRAEQDRIFTQLQSLSYTLRNVLRNNAQADYRQQRGEEFAAS